LVEDIAMSSDDTIQSAPGDAETPDEGCCTIRSAADAVRKAKAELEKARQMYAEVRRKTAERVEAVRKTTVGDMLDGALGVVRKRPGAGLIAAAAAGFLLGRLFRR
jgi:ElaB/YqjD/DUF883 family membrane-anchored ribosome-binding protein